MKRNLLFVLLLIVPFYTFCQNLVVNPGFELWDIDTRPTGWSTAQSCLTDSLTVYAGHYSCRQEGGSTSKYLGQTITVTPRIMLYPVIKLYDEITDNGNGCRIWCFWKDEEGASISDPATDPLLRPSGYLKSDDWDCYHHSFTAPEEAVAFYLEVRTYPKSIVHWDDIEFQETVATGNPELNIPEPLIYPNPVSDFLNITGIPETAEITINNYYGIPVWSSIFHDEETIRIPVSHLRPGAYIISIKTSEKVITKRFIRKP